MNNHRLDEGLIVVALIAGAVMIVMLFTGCGVSRYAANTTASYRITTPDGATQEFSYDSETEKKLVVKLVKEDGKITVLEFSLESGTSEMAISAAINHSQRLTELLEKALKMGAMAGS